MVSFTIVVMLLAVLLSLSAADRDRFSNHYFIRREGDNSGADLPWLARSDQRSDIKEEAQKIYNQIFNP
jgi:hypothetical protein